MQGRHAESLGGVRVMGQCRELVHLNLIRNGIRAAGAGSLAEVLVQCPALAHLNLGRNGMIRRSRGKVWQERWRSAQRWLI